MYRGYRDLARSLNRYRRSTRIIVSLVMLKQPQPYVHMFSEDFKLYLPKRSSLKLFVFTAHLFDVSKHRSQRRLRKIDTLSCGLLLKMHWGLCPTDLALPSSATVRGRVFGASTTRICYGTPCFSHDAESHRGDFLSDATHADGDCLGIA